MTKVKDLAAVLAGLAPLQLQESYDNSGLLVGDPESEVRQVLVCLDSTPEVIEEAIARKCNLVVAHHPVIFGGLKKLTGSNYVERAVMKAIRHDIAIYACHTNLDNVLQYGVNQKLGQKLGLKNLHVLRPRVGLLYKFVTFCPEGSADAVRKAIFNAGAGHIGDYDHCSFNQAGNGTFRGNENTNPYVGNKGEDHTEPEQRIETIVPQWLCSAVVQAMKSSHPYEEAAYDIYPLENSHQTIGAGAIGELNKVLSPAEFLRHVKSTLRSPVIRYTETEKNEIHRVAICGGSGSFLLRDALSAGADAFISSDFKYHQFFDAEGKLMIADIGHYEGEYFTMELLHDILTKNFSTFAVIFSETNSNPIKYYS